MAIFSHSNTSQNLTPSYTHTGEKMSTTLNNPLANLIPDDSHWKTIQEICATLIKSGLAPAQIKSTEAAAIVALKGLQLGIPIIESFSAIQIVQGKMSCSASLQLGLLARGGVTVSYGTCNNSEANMKFSRPGWDDCHASFNMDDAKTAGLLNNPTWKKYPAAMLRARCTSLGARMIGPDLLGGLIYTPEELGSDEIDSENISPIGETINQVLSDFDGELVDTDYDLFLSDCKSVRDQLVEKIGRTDMMKKWSQTLKEFDLKSVTEIDRKDKETQKCVYNSLTDLVEELVAA